jgi:hypothetical protein
LKLAAAAMVAGLVLTGAAQAQSMVAPVVTSNVYQPTYSA